VTTTDHILGSDDPEVTHHRSQAVLPGEPTELLLHRGGIERGMRVLDLGCGPGDMTLQVAAMVGAEGYVVGLERDSAQISVAERRRAAMGVANVEFQQGDSCTFTTAEPFDAVVCRLLRQLPDTVGVLAHHLGTLRPGGVFIAIDYDAHAARALPDVALFSEVRGRLSAACRHAQTEPSIGRQLPMYLGQAGYRQVDALRLQYCRPPSGPYPAVVVGAWGRRPE